MEQTETDKAERQVPLCVDLDGTLVNTDTLVESALLLLKRNPLYILLMLLWLRDGKANLKHEIASRVRLNVSTLPYNTPFVNWLREQRDEGRELVLVSASNTRVVTGVAEHLQLFSSVIASDAKNNISASRKRQRLEETYGASGFDYAGNSKDDLAVWPGCRKAVLVNTSDSVVARARQLATVEASFHNQPNPLRKLLRAMRPHQWSKNSLIFVSILVSHGYGDSALLAATALAFISFCLCSSAVYLINDLLDLEADRQHNEKKKRPFASGQLPLMYGVVATPILLAGSAGLAIAVGSWFSAVLLTYFSLTLMYSFALKRIVLLDVLLLATLYTLRILAGAVVGESPPSVWLLSFSIFLFTSLAMAKRYAELKAMDPEESGQVGGRGYRVSDLAILGQLGTACGYISVLILALYIDTPDIADLYAEQHLMWLLCPLLMYWVGRIWLVASRGELDQDPVIYATRDRTSYVVLALGLVIVMAAL